MNKVAKFIAQLLKEHLNLKYTYNIVNTHAEQRTKQLKIIRITLNHRMLSFEITNRYTNIPMDEGLDIQQMLKVLQTWIQ
jgi:hypothetical protein